MRALAGAALALSMAACQTPQTDARPIPQPVASVAEPKAESSSSLADVEVVKSPGGITAWLVHESNVPVVAVEMAWRGGTVHEPAGREGLGWVLAYMMNEGAGELDTTAYGARMEDLNMEFACGVWTDWTTCSMSTLKDTANDAFDMMELAFSDLRLDEEPFERAKREFAVNIKRDDANPRMIATRAMAQALTPDHPYARQPTASSIASVSRRDVTQLKQQLMTRDRLLVVVVGDITAEDLAPRLDKVFGSLPATSVLPHVDDAKVNPPLAEPLVKELPQAQTQVLFSGPGLKRDDPDFFAAYLLNYTLGGPGISSRLAGDLREKRGLTYSVGSGLSIQPHLWRWTGSISTPNANAEEAVRAIRENIARLGAEGPTEEELADAKAYLTGAFPLAFDSNAKIARTLLGFWQDKQAPDYVMHRNEQLEAVTMDDMKRVARKYMQADAFSFVLVGQPVLD